MVGESQRKFTKVFAKELLKVLARQTGFIQRSTSKIVAQDFVELLTTKIIKDTPVSLEELCDVLHQRNLQAAMTLQALHQQIKTLQVVKTYLKEIFRLSLQKRILFS